MSARRDLPSLDQCLSKLREKKVSGVLSLIPVINMFCFVDWPVSVCERERGRGKTVLLSIASLYVER